MAQTLHSSHRFRLPPLCICPTHCGGGCEDKGLVHGAWRSPGWLQTHNVAKDNLQPLMPLPPLLQCWGDRQVPQSSVCVVLRTEPGALCTPDGYPAARASSPVFVQLFYLLSVWGMQKSWGLNYLPGHLCWELLSPYKHLPCMSLPSLSGISVKGGLVPGRNSQWPIKHRRPLEGRGKGHPHDGHIFLLGQCGNMEERSVFKKTKSVAPAAEQNGLEILAETVGYRTHFSQNFKS